MRESDLQTPPIDVRLERTADDNSGGGDSIASSLVVGGLQINTINNLSGPNISFVGGTSGFSYNSSGVTITLVSPLTTKGDLYTRNSTVGIALSVGANPNGYVLTLDSGEATGLKWAAPATAGTVTTVSVVSANGFAGTVATATTTPAITLSTTINAPVLAGNGTAISAASTTGSASTVVLQTSPSFKGTVGFQSATNNIRMSLAGDETTNTISTSGGTDLSVSSDGTLFLKSSSTTALTIAALTQAATFASTVAATLFNASTGFRISNAATSGNYLRGNGTNFVSSAIQSGDVTTALGYTPTDAAVVPSTAPSAGQILVGNAGNTAYAKQTVSGSGATITLASTGVMTISAIANASLTNSSITINGTSVSLGGTRTLTLASADFVNQGTTTTVLHGNASGNPSFGAVSLTADISGTLGAANGGTGIANNAASTLTISGNFATTLTVTAATGVTLPTTGTLATLAGSEELTNKTLTSSVGKGTWTASGTWTLPAITLGGTVSGGGNQINNVVIGTSTPLAGSFTTLVASTSTKTPIIFPASDSTTAIQITKADGSTRIMDFDTTNARVGINKTPGAFDLDVNGAVNFASTLAVTGHVTLEGVTSTGATGSGKLVFDTSPTFTTPVLGTPTSGTVTNLTGTASININGTVGATTPAAGKFTTLDASGQVSGAGTGNTQRFSYTTTTTGTGYGFGAWTSTGASMLWGIESSVAGTLFSGSGAYDSIWGTNNGTNICFSPNNVVRMKVFSGGGINVGAPTGGDKGVGTANFAADIYKNNTAYTNPHGGFEYAYTGKVVRYADRMAAMGLPDYKPLSLSEMEEYTRKHFHFPYMGDEEENGLFGGGERLLLITEELAVHLFRLDARIKKLEANA